MSETLEFCCVYALGIASGWALSLLWKLLDMRMMFWQMVLKMASRKYKCGEMFSRKNKQEKEDAKPEYNALGLKVIKGFAA